MSDLFAAQEPPEPAAPRDSRPLCTEPCGACVGDPRPCDWHVGHARIKGGHACSGCLVGGRVARLPDGGVCPVPMAPGVRVWAPGATAVVERTATEATS